MAKVIIKNSALFAARMNTSPYPATAKSSQSDDYHGERIADPYRWLEDDRSAETARWVAAQNGVTFACLDQIPWRRALRERLRTLIDYPRYGIPRRRGDLWFFAKNDGLQNQAVWYVRQGLHGTPELLLDPNLLSTDGTVVLSHFSISMDARHVACGISKGGSDWVEARILDVQTRHFLDDRVQWIKASGLAWASGGFYYSRYPAPMAGQEMSGMNEFHSVWFHRTGTPQSEDQLVCEDRVNPRRFHTLDTTEDLRFAVLNISDRGLGKKGNAVFFRDISLPGAEFRPIISEIGDDSWDVLTNVDDCFLLQTNHGAPNGKVVRYRPSTGEFTDVLPECDLPLESTATGGGRLFALYMKDVATEVRVFTLDGTPAGTVPLPAVGTATGFHGLHDDDAVFYSFTSLNYPPTICRYEISTGRSTVVQSPAIPGFEPSDYESKQVFFSSKDGARVPMFLVHRKGLRLDGTNPTLLNGYGGFNITMAPSFSALRLALLEQGFVFACANLRGGGEYGEKWHEAGTKLQKQNVFDDFIAAAEWLIANGYTSSEHLAANGGSNGGLLLAAVMNQRPDLFRAAVPQAGVMDMLRFQKFTIGWNWIADYGSSDNPAEFAALRAYSPLHNVRPGAKYPAVLITTADHDDRVVPAHSFKYAAALQEAADPARPVLIRIETNSGHGASSTSKQVEITADVYAFLLCNLGVTPKF